jgi:hypothetical protein
MAHTPHAGPGLVLLDADQAALAEAQIIATPGQVMMEYRLTE